MARQAILFGLNYEETLCAPYQVPGSYETLNSLKGSINDVKNVEKMLSSPGWNFESIRVFTDATCSNDECPKKCCPDRTTAEGIKQEMTALAERSKKDNLEIAWIHFSGHGISMYDENCDERDWYDECILPSDFKDSGPISDDSIREILLKFNPNTKVICVFDCNHSGTIGDLKYRFLESGEAVHREHNNAACPSKVIIISGCMDDQSAIEKKECCHDEEGDDCEDHHCHEEGDDCEDHHCHEEGDDCEDHHCHDHHCHEEGDDCEDHHCHDHHCHEEGDDCEDHHCHDHHCHEEGDDCEDHHCHEEGKDCKKTQSKKNRNKNKKNKKNRKNRKNKQSNKEETCNDDDCCTYTGAMTTSLLNSIESMGSDPKNIKIHELVKMVRTTLKSIECTQHPELTCSYFIEENESLF
uniref:Peptidase C14 caspase domain-containing protein n=1 Tax=Pyramimonas orientalis virus TaxID=455367 RepID=A0A7L9AY48_POV01|nr:hypothetical protein HWQ62_00498 [Pyramimonas orientalis virus]